MPPVKPTKYQTKTLEQYASGFFVLDLELVLYLKRIIIVILFTNGALVQLDRMLACHVRGHGFEPHTRRY